jgi:hypothetical protein
MIYKGMCSDTLRVVKLELSAYFTYASCNEVLEIGGKAAVYGSCGVWLASQINCLRFADRTLSIH